SPLEWVIVHKFSGLGILSVSGNFIPERSDHLRMAGIATFLEIDISSMQFEWGIRLYCCNCRHITLNQKSRYKLNYSSQCHNHQGSNQHLNRTFFNPPVPMLTFDRDIRGQ